MFQGRPSAEEGDFFNVGKIKIISREDGAERRRECSVLVRAWDLAATEAGGDYSVGALMGMRSDGSVTVFDVVRSQVDTAGRDELQRQTAERDGGEVIVTVPQDVGAGGKSTAFHITQNLKGYQVITRSVSGSKENRARNYSAAVNSGMVEFVDDSHLPEDLRWIEAAKKEMRDFPLSDHDDIIDAKADGYNESYERLIKGLVISNLKPQRNLITYSAFANKFPYYSENKLFLKIPQNFQIYAAVKISADSSLPTCGVVTARASINSGLTETIIGISEYKKYDGNYENLFIWLKDTLASYCLAADVKNTTVWLHKDSAHFQLTIIEKLKTSVAVFDGDDAIGLAETNWYLMPKESASPFNQLEKAAGMYLLVDDNQISEATGEDNNGFYHARQEASTWGYNDKGEPTRTGAVLDCLRMCVAEYSTYATPLTADERYRQRLQEMMPAAMQNEGSRPIEETIGFSREVTLQMNDMLLQREMRRSGEDVDYSPFDGDYEDPTDISGGW